MERHAIEDDDETDDIIQPTWDEVMQSGLQALADGLIRKRQSRR
jgi:hypothetical protein